MDVIDIPQAAVESFEKSTGLDLSYHVIDMALWTYLPSTRMLHYSPACVAVKHTHLNKCIAFEQPVVRAELLQRPDGFLKVCHAGLVEWVVPVRHGEDLSMVIFAGQRLSSAGLSALNPVGPDKPSAGVAGLIKGIKPVGVEEAGRLMEQTRQLGARLEQWLVRMEGMTGSPQHADRDRRRWIEVFITRFHADNLSISDLALAMGLSEGRCAHVVKEVTGTSFGDLLTQVRVRTAAALLTHTNLPLIEVAGRAGFGDLSNFHRRFKERMKVTPHQFRKHGSINQQSVALTIEQSRRGQTGARVIDPLSS